MCPHQTHPTLEERQKKDLVHESKGPGGGKRATLEHE